MVLRNLLTKNKILGQAVLGLFAYSINQIAAAQSLDNELAQHEIVSENNAFRPNNFWHNAFFNTNKGFYLGANAELVPFNYFKDVISPASPRQIYYQLAGYDKDWKESHEMHIRYSNLSVGTHTLTVYTSAQDSNRAESPLTITIDVIPTFYYTWWALLIYTFIILILAYIVIRHISIKKLSIKPKKRDDSKVKDFSPISQHVSEDLMLMTAPIEKRANDTIDPTFIRALNDLIENHLTLTDGDLCVNYIARTLGVSAPVLYKKVKTTSGLSVNNYVKSYRLNKAKEMLHLRMNISEVAYSVGFSDRKYFSKEFKKHFGINPSDQRRLYDVLASQFADKEIYCID